MRAILVILSLAVGFAPSAFGAQRIAAQLHRCGAGPNLCATFFSTIPARSFSAPLILKSETRIYFERLISRGLPLVYLIGEIRPRAVAPLMAYGSPVDGFEVLAFENR